MMQDIHELRRDILTLRWMRITIYVIFDGHKNSIQYRQWISYMIKVQEYNLRNCVSVPTMSQHNHV